MLLLFSRNLVLLVNIFYLFKKSNKDHYVSFCGRSDEHTIPISFVIHYTVNQCWHRKAYHSVAPHSVAISSSLL